MAEIQSAYEKLCQYSDEEALLILQGYEEKRKSEHYAKYWSCDPDPQYAMFFDSIEDSFNKLTKDIKIYTILGGNRSSKTERGAFLAVAWLMGKSYFENEPSWRFVKDLPIPEHGVNIWACGLDFSVIKDVIWSEKLRRGHRHPGLFPATPSPLVTRISDSEFQIMVDVSGRKSSLTCKSADSGPEKMQSASIDLVWIDEECSVDVFDELFQRTVDCAGKILVTCTPLLDVGSGAKKPWLYDLHTEWLQGRKDVVFVKLSALDNPFIPEEEKVKLLQKWRGHSDEGARLYGDFIKRSGLVYPQWDKTKHVLKKQSLPPEWRRIISIDPAATGITACVWLAVSPRNDVYLYRVYYERDKIVSEHAKDILMRNGSDRIDTWIIDPYWGAARGAETHKQGYQLYRENGCPVRLAPRSEDFGRDTMAEYLSASLDTASRHPKFFVVGELPEFVNEIERYVWDSWSKGPNKGMSKDKPMKRMDHLINAIQYGLSLRPKGRAGSGLAQAHNANASYT